MSLGWKQKVGEIWFPSPRLCLWKAVVFWRQCGDSEQNDLLMRWNEKEEVPGGLILAPKDQSKGDFNPFEGSLVAELACFTGFSWLSAPSPRPLSLHPHRALMYDFPAVWLWATNLTFLCLSFPSCKIGIITPLLLIVRVTCDHSPNPTQSDCSIVMVMAIVIVLAPRFMLLIIVMTNGFRGWWLSSPRAILNTLSELKMIISTVLWLLQPGHCCKGAWKRQCRDLGPVPVLLLHSCVTSGKSLYLSEPQNL